MARRSGRWRNSISWARTWTAWSGSEALDGIAGRVVFVNTTSSSFPFVQDLSAKNRIVIAATDSAAQRFDTMFPEYFIEALDKVSAADGDKNGRLSVWEAFAYASQAVKAAFDQKGTMVTERAVIDDNGDGVAKEATATGADGVLAKTTFLDAEPASTASNPAAAALEKQRVALEAQIEELKGRKGQWRRPTTTRSWKSSPSTSRASPPRSAPPLLHS